MMGMSNTIKAALQALDNHITDIERKSIAEIVLAGTFKRGSGQLLVRPERTLSLSVSKMTSHS